MLPFHPDLQAALEATTERLLQATVRVRGPAGSSGSGVAWRPDGLVVTNAHVARHPRLIVELHDGTSHRARLVARDERRDVAVLQLADVRLTTPEFGDPALLRPGSLVLAAGYPFGHRPAVAAGVAHAAGLALGTPPRRLLADVQLHPGNSGGPLADARGRVIGVNAMIVSGLGVAIARGEVDAVVAAVSRGRARAA
jgi:serine protease Do